MGVVFFATKGLYNISGLFVIFKCSAHVFFGTCPGLFINSHNAQFYCIKGKWYNRRHHLVLVGQKKNICVWTTDIKLGLNLEPVSLHSAQNCSSSVLKTLQSRCRALKVFYQTSLMPLWNVFYHVYEKNLKWLEIVNISSVSKLELNSSNKFFRFNLQMDVYW